jgi:Flp pilus assembly protein TadG
MAGSAKRSVRRRTDQGAAAVEFALVFPLLIMLLIGLVTTGLVYFDHSSASNAVREAARYGAAVDASTPSTWATSVRDRLKQTYFDAANNLSDTQMNDHICVDLVGSSGTTITGSAWTGTQCGTAPPLPTSMAAGSCVVRVWMNKPEKINLVVFPSMNFNIGAESVAYYGRTTPAVNPVCKAVS